MTVAVLVVAAAGLPTSLRPADPAGAAANARFFESKIRPLLAEKCFKCHGEKKQKADLRLDSRVAILAGGESGPALVPGRPDGSRLVRAVRYTDAELQMPPKKKLADAEIALLERWVAQGAVWPASDGSGSEDEGGGRRRGGRFEITDDDRAWWAFQVVELPAAPKSTKSDWGTNPIDAFILARLEAKQLTPSRPAKRQELIRRAFFDLTGLPPTASESDRFVADDDPTAWESLIDDLLARPQFGERWGRHWLDVVRFAQTNGYERDGEKPFVWRYRDYVIRSINEDKPYDRFVMEQLAGDELEDPTSDSIIATAFYHLGVWDDEPDDKRQAEFDGLDDMVVATGAAFLGLTVGCARCHDHMFDPISQKDYYRLLAFLRNVRSYDHPKYADDSPTYSRTATSKEIEKWKADRSKLVHEARQKLATASVAEKKRLEAEIEELEGQQPPFEWALSVKEKGRAAASTHVLVRGSSGTPAEEVKPGFLTVLAAGASSGGKSSGRSAEPVPAEIREAPKRCHSSGRRRALAEWIASADHPLTARVLVNRVWQHLFGRGIVRTPNDFGRRGLPPTHPELIDWLAREFIDGGWKLKPLIRTVMLSSAYRLSARASDPRKVEVDPGNDLFWRQNLKRLEAEAIRDSVLAASGELDLKMGGRGVFPRLSPDVIAGGSRPGWGWGFSSYEERARRSVYIYTKRGTLMPLIEGFDYTNTAQSLGARSVTTVAPQALMLLNSRFLSEQSRRLAARVAEETADGGGDRTRIVRAYRRVYGRDPSEREHAQAQAFLERQEKMFEATTPRIVFRPAVPAAIEKGFQGLHGPADYFFDAPEGWGLHRGLWTDAGDNINWVDPARGPFALWKGESFLDADVVARIILHANSAVGSLLLRGRAKGDVFEGYELAFDPREALVSLNRHRKGKDVQTLSSVRTDITTERAINVKVECRGGRFRVWVGRPASDKPTLEVTDTGPAGESGEFGVRTWGAALSVESLAVAAGEKQSNLTVKRQWPVAMDALASLCLVLMNTNEFVYVD